jgi:hypothetical protein
MVGATGLSSIDYGTCLEFNTYQQQFIKITDQTLTSIYNLLDTMDKYAYIIFIYEINNAEFGLMLVFKKDYIYLYSGPINDENLIKKWAWSSNTPFYISYYVIPEWVGGEHTGVVYNWYYLAFNYNGIETKVLLGNNAKLVRACFHGNINPTTIYYENVPPTEIPTESSITTPRTMTYDPQNMANVIGEFTTMMMNIIQPMMSIMMISMMISIPMTMMRMMSSVVGSE